MKGRKKSLFDRFARVFLAFAIHRLKKKRDFITKYNAKVARHNEALRSTLSENELKADRLAELHNLTWRKFKVDIEHPDGEHSISWRWAFLKPGFIWDKCIIQRAGFTEDDAAKNLIMGAFPKYSNMSLDEINLRFAVKFGI